MHPAASQAPHAATDGRVSEVLGLGAPSWNNLIVLLSRLGWNLLCATAVILFVYYRLYRTREHVFTYYLFNTITFCLCLLLRRVSVEFGFALALFGVFGILRYRTEQIRTRDLTYLFIVIGIGILNAVADRNVSFAELLVVNGVVIGLTMLLELGPLRSEESAPMLYDQLALLKPGQEARLIEDLASRTGLEVLRVHVNKIDLLRDAAEITVHYRRTS